MPITITDPELVAELERLAAERGKTEEEVVRDTFIRSPRLLSSEPNSAQESQRRYNEIVAAADAFAAKLKEPLRAADANDLLYDEHGLPK